MNYIEIKDQNGVTVCVFEPTIGSIPVDPANTDYQKYLEWLSEGNEPLPADDTTE
jgi:hypothetical protein